MAATTGSHSLNLMACVRESSPPQDAAVDADSVRNATKRRRFHPFRGLRRMFRRKVRHSGSVMPAPTDPPVEIAPVVLDTHRSRSTSELLAGDEPNRRRSGTGFYGGHSGLSVSHDSVFSAEQHSDHSSSEDMGQSSSSLSIQQIVLPGVKAELFDAVRRRRGGGGGGGGRGDTSEDDEDLGLPRSPCISPTTVDVLREKGHKENPTKSHSTCSDGSLLSMGSSEMDEDSLGEHSGHSSKLSLHDKKLFYDNDNEFDLGISATPLSHSAARHKMSVRPKRTHGAPRRRRTQQLSVVNELPTTPEVNEEMLGRSYSPDLRTNDLNRDLNASAEPLDWLPNDNPLTAETQLKSASLPPGLALSSALPALLSRSRSSASKITEYTSPQYRRNLSTSELEMKEPKAPNQIGAEVLRSRELFGAVGEEDEEEDRTDEKKKEESFFGRLLSRRSGKKKKEKGDEEELKVKTSEVPIPIVPKRMDEKGRYANERAYDSNSRNKMPLRPRQRVEPINLPVSPELMRKDTVREIDNYLEANSILGTSPTRSDMSNRMQISYSASPPKPTWPEGSAYSKQFETDTKIVDFVAKSKPEEPTFKPKLKIGGLTSYQQKLTNFTDNHDERDYSSLIHTSTEDDSMKHSKVSLKKSKSFRESVESSLSDNDFPSISVVYGNDSQFRSNNAKLGDKETIPVSHNPENVDNEENGLESSNKQAEHKGFFTKNIFITSRSAFKDSKAGVKQDNVIKKSTSLESISSIDNLSASLYAGNKSSSTESVSSLTKQITTTPVDSGGISITQTVSAVDRTSLQMTKQTWSEESKNTMTVSAPITVCISSKPVETTNETLFNSPSSPHTLSNVMDETSTDVAKRNQLPKRDTSRGSQEISHVPEFMRVQLNRVDSKPALNIVLSTSAIFDTDKIEVPKTDQPLKAQVETVSIPASATLTEVHNVEKVTNETSIDDVPRVSLLGLRIRKASHEDINIVESPKKENTFEKVDNITFRSQDVTQKPVFDVKVEPVPKPRSISLIPTVVQPMRKLPVISPPTSPLRPAFKKQSSSKEIEESQIEKRRQFSGDFENIQIVEKEINQVTTPRKKSVPNNDVEVQKPELKVQKPEIKVQKPEVKVQKPEVNNDSVSEVVLRKKPSVRDLFPRSEDSIIIVEKQVSGDESPEVIMRKKSRDFGLRRDEEPELLKVFARRSLKIKDSDTEALGQLVAKRESIVTEPETKSRDSDKENEGDSPKDERKKLILTKEPLVESKPQTEETSLKSSTIPSTVFSPRFKYQRSVSIIGTQPVVEINGTSTKENIPSIEKKHRKSVPEGPTSISEKIPHRWTNIYKDKEIDLTNTELNKPIVAETIPVDDNEENIPRFKRIQQRKEEWELRAQQAAKKTIP